MVASNHYIDFGSRQKDRTDTKESAGKLAKVDYKALEEELEVLLAQERDETKKALLEEQTEFTNLHLNSKAIRESIGEKLGDDVLERLSKKGVINAMDVTPQKIKSVGRLPAATQALLLGWKAEAESEAKNAMPQKLNQRESSKIMHKYKKEKERLRSAITEFTETRKMYEIAKQIAKQKEQEYLEKCDLEVRKLFIESEAETSKIDKVLEDLSKKYLEDSKDIEEISARLCGEVAVVAKKVDDSRELLKSFDGIGLEKYVRTVLWLK